MNAAKRYAPWLWFLLAVFCVRVFAQLLALNGPLQFLPDFDDWHSATVPYAALLSAQIVIIVVCGWTAWRFGRGDIKSNAPLGMALLGIGSVYFTVMAVRLVLGLAVLGSHPWFGKVLPALFHLVLAAFVLLVGLFHIRAVRGLSEKIGNVLVWLTYPAVVISAFVLHYIFKSLDVELFVATYGPGVFAAAAVTLLEWRSPERRHWRPNSSEIANDFSFMIAIQVLLPPALSLLAVFALVDPIQRLSIVPAGFWPHHWPIAAQGILILFSGDFLRYWLHRASHKNQWLWRLHAVHHSPDKLYWLNVGRFHPLEKALQFLCDSLPFIVLGVSKEAIAFYFLFYTVNGFLLHSNVRLRYGFLNYLINTAELHRWHHSRLPKESDNNYGNHVVIWDLLFGTWFLPKKRAVGPLGLKVKGYPRSFLAQLRAPFVRATRS